MAVDLASNALVTAAQAAAFAGIESASTQEEDAFTTLINRVSGMIEAYIGRRIVRHQWTNLRMRGQSSCDLLPPSAPIHIDQAISITLDGVAQTVWTQESDGDPATFDVEVAALVPGSPWAPDKFCRRAGWIGRTETPIVLTYRGGFDPPTGGLGDFPIPEQFTQAALEWVKDLYLLQTQGTQGMETISTPTGTFTKSARSIPPRVEQWIGADRLVSV